MRSLVPIVFLVVLCTSCSPDACRPKNSDIMPEESTSKDTSNQVAAAIATLTDPEGATDDEVSQAINTLQSAGAVAVPAIERALDKEMSADSTGFLLSSLWAIGIDSEVYQRSVRPRFDSTDARVRAQVVALGWRTLEDPTGLLALAARDTDARVRIEAAVGYRHTKLANSAGIEGLSLLLRDSNADVLIASLNAVPSVSEGSLAIQELAEALCWSEHSEVRSVAMTVAVAHAEPMQRKIELLGAGLDDPEGSVRRAAIRSMLITGGEGAPLVAKYVKAVVAEGDIDLEDASILVLERIGTGAVAELVKLVESEDSTVRRYIARALAIFGGQMLAINTLQKLLDDTDPLVASTAHNSLVQIRREQRYQGDNEDD